MKKERPEFATSSDPPKKKRRTRGTKNHTNYIRKRAPNIRLLAARIEKKGEK